MIKRMEYNGKEKCECGKPAEVEIEYEWPNSTTYRYEECDERWQSELEWEVLGETEYKDSIVCPYCGNEDPNSWETQEDDDEYMCGACEKTFEVTVHHSAVTYSTKRRASDMPDDWKGEDEE